MNKRRGVITISTVISIVGGMAVGIVWVVGYVNTAVAPVQASVDQAKTENAAYEANVDSQVSAINTKLDFLLGKYGVKYEASSGKIDVSTSTN